MPRSPATRWALLALVASLHFGPAASIPALAGDTVEVGIREYRYDPPELKVKAGTTVRWVNNEKRVSHSIFFLGPGGYESDRIFPGESFQRTFDQPGRYPYTCGPHPEMKGVVDVE
ncbi:MAG TPA: plastocyanin/azurin family copper-binding protein [Rhodocyclaceae bacterium]|nr:plastocyanin/azurin family copper-binding protein [Rhodocyclaceae bacterium]HNH36386.1 plastocyanin/azurin family copper-binding protein [Rhodocyclaceae bacterium]